MAYVIYHKDTTLLLRAYRRNGTYVDSYETEAAAKSALTRAVKKGNGGKPVNRDDYLIAEKGEFFKNIEKQVQKINLMSKQPFMIGVNAPLCLDPSTETYWSM